MKISNFKFLNIVCLLVIAIGLVLLWTSTKSITNQPISFPIPSVVESTPEATDSTSLTASSPGVVGIAGEQVLVTDVIDGDTVKIRGNITVRLLGIDTPETKHPRKPVQCFGKEAAGKTRELVMGKYVILEKDISETDKYGRLLRYVFLPIEDGRLLFVNDYLIREGFARTLTYPPDVKYTENFLEAQTQAKQEQRGLWSQCIL